MTREEAKQLLPVIQAFAEGKQIEFCSFGKWVDMTIESPNFDSGSSHYRVKPESKYRPFKTAEECWKEMQNHQPFGWIKDKDGDYLLPTTVGNESDFILRFKLHKFADGTPFGIKEE